MRHADALENVLEGHWLSLHLNGQPYPDKPPVYFWLVAASAGLLGTTGPPAFFLVSALGGFLFLVATWALARATLQRDRPGLALAAPLLVSATPLYQLLLRTTRMDLLFGALIAAAFLALGRACTGARGGVVAGLALGGLATLIKGPLGIALPLAALVLWCLWTARVRRLVAWDVALGLGAALGLVGAWAVGIGLAEGWGYLRDLLGGQVLARALEPHAHTQPAWFYAATLPVAWLPWTALLVAVPWRRLVAPQAWRTALTGRRGDERARTWLIACTVAGVVLLSLASSKLFIYLLPLLAPMAVLTTEALAGLDAPRSVRTWAVVGAGLLLVGLLLPWAGPWQPFAEVHLRGLVPTAVPFALAGILVLATRRGPLARPLAATVVGCLLAHTALAGWVAPSFDPVMSPRAQARALADLADRGYAPLVFRTYPGTFTYHARRDLPETRDPQALRDHVAAHPQVVIAMPEKYVERFQSLLEGLVRFHPQRIEGQPFVLLARPDPAQDPAR